MLQEKAANSNAVQECDATMQKKGIVPGSQKTTMTCAEKHVTAPTKYNQNNSAA